LQFARHRATNVFSDDRRSSLGISINSGGEGSSDRDTVVSGGDISKLQWHSGVSKRYEFCNPGHRSATRLLPYM